ADGGVVHALGKADLAQGRVALRYADAEAKIVAVPTPNLQHLLRRFAHRDGHLDCALRRFRCGQRIIEKDHHPIAAVVVERPLEAGHNRPECGVIVAQEGHYLFRLGPLGKSGETAYIAEDDDNLATMTFEDA